MARDQIAGFQGGSFEKEEVYIRSVSQTGERDAVAEATLQAAFKFEKVDGKWVIREIRLGKRPWEKIDDILHALDGVKAANTRGLLEQVADAIEKYRQKNGTLPPFTDYISLTDALHPNFLTPLIREDAWHHPLMAHKVGNNAVRLTSPGPDGKSESADDIVVTRQFPP